MPSPITLTEADFLLRPGFEAPRAGRCRAGHEFETLAKLERIDIARLDPAARGKAVAACAGCACRKACRRWLRTGVFRYSGDSRCPNAALLRQ